MRDVAKTLGSKLGKRTAANERNINGRALRLALTTYILTNLFVFTNADAKPIKIATWNIEYLRAVNNVKPNKRNTKDYERLAKYAKRLDADIIALQEVEGPSAAGRVFDPAVRCYCCLIA